MQISIILTCGLRSPKSGVAFLGANNEIDTGKRKAFTGCDTVGIIVELGDRELKSLTFLVLKEDTLLFYIRVTAVGALSAVLAV